MPRSTEHPSTRPWRTIARLCVNDGVPKRSLLVALIVGVVLNLINQGDVLITGDDVNGLKVALTFIVPYCVATYGAVSYQLMALKAESRALPMAADASTHGHAETSRSEDQRQAAINETSTERDR